MRFAWDPAKERRNQRLHGLDFSFAELVFADRFMALVYDRYEGGEHRWHAVGMVTTKVLVVVHSYPDPDDEDWIRIISLREATAHERRRYEEYEFR